MIVQIIFSILVWNSCLNSENLWLRISRRPKTLISILFQLNWIKVCFLNLRKKLGYLIILRTLKIKLQNVWLKFWFLRIKTLAVTLRWNSFNKLFRTTTSIISPKTLLNSLTNYSSQFQVFSFSSKTIRLHSL